ncbi:capsular polysaccharide synthesis protein [Tatumella saanichensis]|uniref:capsular polysaccharide synthesis protein n=1 Tax=Tatumella saanichensis TaxID=480813 RepID=UPI001375EEAB|nr:capsular polysaccharide synthesis protein [Tatumella saanichensis]
MIYNNYNFLKALKILRFISYRLFGKKKLFNYINELVKNRIRKDFSRGVHKSNNNHIVNASTGTGVNTIWVCWLQGEARAPRIVENCIRSIRRNSPDGYKVIVIDNDNYKNFVEIPEEITNKYESGIITKTHFSDILRWSLLSMYGGFWMDSTIYINRNINFISSMDFFTLKEKNYSEEYITKGRWSGFFIKCPYNYHPAKLIYSHLIRYWKENNEMIDYFLIDYILDYVYEESIDFRKDVDALPYYGDCIYKIMNSVNNNECNECNEDIGIYKLSYKITTEDEDLILKRVSSLIDNSGELH